MYDVYQNNNNKLFGNFNNINNPNRNIYSYYVPYEEYLPGNNYFNYNNFQFSQPISKPSNTDNNQPIQNKENDCNMKIETDSDLIQSLTGKNLDEDENDSYSETKKPKKEIEINLGDIVVDNCRLEGFPFIELKNKNNYNILVPENILNSGELFTAVKEDTSTSIDVNEIEMDEQDNPKVLVPDGYYFDLNENFSSYLSKTMNKNEISQCVKSNKLVVKNTIEALYDKSIYCISEIKRNIKNRVKKIKSIGLSNQLLNIIKFHNELRELFLSKYKKGQNSNINKIEEKDKDHNFITYAQFYIQSNGGKTFECEVCGKKFVNHQTLGGHMSKVHPNCSEKYKKLSNIRKQREGKRKKLDLVKAKLFEKYNLDYESMKEKDEKEKIKSFIKDHQKEYEILRRKMYRENVINE